MKNLSDKKKIILFLIPVYFIAIVFGVAMYKRITAVDEIKKQLQEKEQTTTQVAIIKSDYADNESLVNVGSVDVISDNNDSSASDTDDKLSAKTDVDLSTLDEEKEYKTSILKSDGNNLSEPYNNVFDNKEDENITDNTAGSKKSDTGEDKKSNTTIDKFVPMSIDDIDLSKEEIQKIVEAENLTHIDVDEITPKDNSTGNTKANSTNTTNIKVAEKETKSNYKAQNTDNTLKSDSNNLSESQNNASNKKEDKNITDNTAGAKKSDTVANNSSKTDVNYTKEPQKIDGATKDEIKSVDDIERDLSINIPSGGDFDYSKFSDGELNILEKISKKYDVDNVDPTYEEFEKVQKITGESELLPNYYDILAEKQRREDLAFFKEANKDDDKPNTKVSTNDSSSKDDNVIHYEDIDWDNLEKYSGYDIQNMDKEQIQRMATKDQKLKLQQIATQRAIELIDSGYVPKGTWQ